MRLIDADALKEELRSWLALPNRDNDAKDVVLHLISVIDDAPTVKHSLNLDDITEDDIEKFKMIWQRATSKGLLVINEERSPGKWELRGERYYCSECGEEAINLESEPDVYGYNYCLTSYCPNCGADMEKEINEAD